MQRFMEEEKEHGEVKGLIVPVDKKGDDQGEGGGKALILRLKSSGVGRGRKELLRLILIEW